MSRAAAIPLACPICGEPMDVYDTLPEGNRVRRRRQCKNGHRFNTTETYQGPVRSYPTRIAPPDNESYDEVEAELLAERGW